MAVLIRLVFRALILLKFSRGNGLDGTPARFLLTPWGAEVRVSYRAYATTILVPGSSDCFKDSTAANAAPGHWSLGARARRLPGCHRQGQAGSGMGAAIAACRRLVLAAAMVVRWSMGLNVIFMFEVFCISGKSL